MSPRDSLEKHLRILLQQKVALKRLGIATVEDLFYHFPVRYGDTAEKKNIGMLEAGEAATIFGKISKLKTKKAFRSKIPMAEATVEDDTGTIKVVWFNQAYIAKMIAEGTFVRLDGKVTERNGVRSMSNPKIEAVAKIPVGVGESLFGEEGEAMHLYPVYPESRGITSNWMYHAINKLMKAGAVEAMTDPLPLDIRTRYNLPQLSSALVWIHAPQKEADAVAARKRFAFEEVFMIQLARARERAEWDSHKAFIIEKSATEMEQFIKTLPFEPTEGQRRAIETILADFAGGRAMSRLLEGDVGSGKTAVAAATAWAAATTRPRNQGFGTLQVAYMCPTEILATQHFESFIQCFRGFPIQIALITGSGCRKFPSKVNKGGWTDISRTQLLKWVASGEIAVVVGTHALIQKSVKFKDLAFAIIDEQHRFGTAQRRKLIRKDSIAPHLLSMTATPIPRTLALTVYGDLDLSVLDQMPTGRKPIITEIITPDKREEMYEKVRRELRLGKQAYIICPRIAEPDPDKETALIAKSVIEEAKRLKRDVFQEYSIAVLHSKMKPAEKDAVMLDFKAGKFDILVATSVVEVGVNVPNATSIVIEGAERFGLSQLHQLRGRVIRSNDQAYCYIFAETKSDKTIERLKAFIKAKNGFELAEYDLQLRGAGELSGSRQWGMSDIGMEALKNLRMVEAARAEALRLIKIDPSLSSAPLAREIIESKEHKELHFE